MKTNNHTTVTVTLSTDRVKSLTKNINQVIILALAEQGMQYNQAVNFVEKLDYSTYLNTINISTGE